MKKIVCMALVALLCLSGAALAGDKDMILYEYPEVGITFSLPDDFNDMKGTVAPVGTAELLNGTGVYGFGVYYFAMPRAEYEALGVNSSNINEVLPDNTYAPYITLIVVDEDLGMRFLHEMFGEALEDFGFTEIARVENYTFFNFKSGEEQAHLDGPEYDAEYITLLERVDEVLAMCDFYLPNTPYTQMAGTQLSFETTDLDGNPIDSASLFGQHEYTLLNIWASWCGLCVGELNDLDALNQKLADVDCGVVGLLQDSAEAENVETAKGIMAEKGANYLCIKAPEGFDDMLYIASFPTTYIIDRNGTVVGAPVVGAYLEVYEKRLNAVLNGEAVEAEAAVEDKPTYTVTVLDQNGDPVAEAAVGFCLDTGCVPVETDENGVAVFHGAVNRYHIQVVDAPDEYDYPDESDIYIGPESGEVTLTITKE